MDRSEHYAAPGQYEVYTSLPAKTASDATDEHLIFVVPESIGDRGAKILSVSVIPQGAATGHGTNRKNLNTKIDNTERGNVDLVAGTNLVARTKLQIYPDADGDDGHPRILAPGGTVAIEIEKAGSGVATPQMLAEVVYQPA